MDAVSLIGILNTVHLRPGVEDAKQRALPPRLNGPPCTSTAGPFLPAHGHADSVDPEPVPI
jgi:hypothetical protein